MERNDYLSALVRGWWLIAIFGLVGLAVGLLLPRPNLVHETHWVSGSAFGSAPPAPANTGSQFGGGISPDQILYYANSDAVMQSTSQLAHLNEPPWEVRSQISLIGPPEQTGPSSSAPSSGQAGVIDVQTVGSTSAAALNLNNAFDQAVTLELTDLASQGLKSNEQQTQQTLLTIENEIATKNYPLGLNDQALQVQVNALQQHLAGLVVQQPYTGFQLLQNPSASTVSRITPSSATNSRPVRAAAGLAIGLVIGALAALARWFLDRRLKTARRAQVAFGYPVVGEIPPHSSDSTEPYRLLWLSVFREPLPLPPSDHRERFYEGEDPVLESGVGSGSGQAGSP
jgi:hypothetical protein